jgi:hypothetical protein
MGGCPQALAATREVQVTKHPGTRLAEHCLKQVKIVWGKHMKNLLNIEHAQRHTRQGQHQ